MHKLPPQHDEIPIDASESTLTSEKVLSRVIPWDALRSNFLQARDEQLIILYDKQPINAKMELLNQRGEDYANLFIKLVVHLTKLETLQYVLTLIEEILIEDESKASIFLRLNNPDLPLAPFFKLLNLNDEPDWYLTSKVCHILAILINQSLQVHHEEAKQLLRWIKNQLSKTEPLELITPLSTLQLLLKKDELRILFYNEDGIPTLAGLLKTQHSNFQVLYQTTFCLWLLSYNAIIAENFHSSNAIPSLVNILRTITKDKVVRMSIATLRNLVKSPKNTEQMIETNLLKEVEKLSQKKWADEEVVADLEALNEVLQKSVTELSSFDMYKQELYSGTLEWSPVHRSEKFWRENAIHFEENDCKPLKYLLGYLSNPQSTSQSFAIACYDIGEFVRLHPRGRTLIQNLGGKDEIMRLMYNKDLEVQKQALLCLQKLMVHNWEYLSR